MLDITTPLIFIYYGEKYVMSVQKRKIVQKSNLKVASEKLQIHTYTHIDQEMGPLEWITPFPYTQIGYHIIILIHSHTNIVTYSCRIPDNDKCRKDAGPRSEW